MLVKISICKKKNISVSLQIGSRTKGLSKRDYEVKWSLFETDNDAKKKRRRDHNIMKSVFLIITFQSNIYRNISPLLVTVNLWTVTSTQNFLLHCNFHFWILTVTQCNGTQQTIVFLTRALCSSKGFLKLKALKQSPPERWRYVIRDQKIINRYPLWRGSYDH